MKKLKNVLASVLFLAVLLVFVCEANAQLAIEIKCSQENYLQYEPIFVKVRITNKSGTSLAFGAVKQLAGKISFEIFPSFRRKDRIQLSDTMVVPQIKDTIIPTGATSEIIYKVSDYFNISGPGKYGIKVKIFHPLLKETYESNETGFTITKGQVFWETVVGVPDFEDNGLDPERKRKMVKTRTYRILTSSIGKANVYTLKVEDKERVYQLKRIGFDLGVNLAPKCEIDYLSRLHIIVAASPHVFIYYQFDTNGKMISREVRMKSDSSPKLFVDTKTGVVTIYGGRFAVPEDNDEIQSLPFLQDYNKSAPKDFTIPQMDSGIKAE